MPRDTLAPLELAQYGLRAKIVSHQKQNCVVVAIESNLAHPLDVTRLLAFLPQAIARSRPVVRETGCRRALQRFAVHPRQREDVPAGSFLGYRRNEALSIPFDVIK